jgi:hypothetical protein
VITWDDDTLDQFVYIANVYQAVQRPRWMGGLLSIQQFKVNIINHLSLVAGGSYGTTCLAPNTFQQYEDVKDRLRDMETDPWLQGCLAQLPANAVLGTCARIMDNRLVSPTPIGRRALPAPNRLMLA